MASMMPKQLAQFLQEQQEPFVLEVYLLERGHDSQKDRFRPPEAGSRSCSAKAKPCLKRSVSRQKFIPNCSKVVRALFSKLLALNNDQKLEIRDQRSGVPEIEAAEENFLSASSTAVFNSCSESDPEEAHYSSKSAGELLKADHQESSKFQYELTENEVTAGWKFRRRDTEDSKQLSPEERESHRGSPVVRTTAKQPLKSVFRSKPEKQIHKRTQQGQDFVGSNSNASPHYSKNRKAVQQTKQLLFDCVREVMEKHKRQPGGQQFQGILGAEQLWELICENLCLWSKESINETNITHLPHTDVLDSAHQWSDFEKQKQDIGFLLGNAIFEDVSNEIITEMITFYRDK